MDSPNAYAQLSGNSLPADALRAESSDPFRVQDSLWAPELLTLGLGVPQSSLYSFDDQSALQLGHRPEDSKDHFAGWCARVELLGEGNELNALRPERLQRA
jgi:hypothetical protein